jgi:hypothetical protein
MTPVEFAEPYSPERCRAERDENMALARLARLPRGHFYYETNQEIVRDAVHRARDWNRIAVAGGNDAYHYQLANAR